MRKHIEVAMSDSGRENCITKNAFVHVYVARFPFPAEEKIYPLARKDEIASCASPKVRCEKFYSWKLLEIALMRSLGLRMEDVKFTRTAYGKWECSACRFSLTHSGDLVAVALSEKPVGVDIERSDESRFTDALIKKVATMSEEEALMRLDTGRAEVLNALWTKKEAIFKLLGDGAFRPRSIEASDYVTVTKIAKSAEEEYILTVASDGAERAIFYGDGTLEILAQKN